MVFHFRPLPLRQMGYCPPFYMTLQYLHPDVYEEAVNESFSFRKTNRQFSRMSLDQVHEQNNAVIKGKAGVTDLLNRSEESGLIRWETVGPEISRILHELEEDFSPTDSDTTEKSLPHHQDNKGSQKRFCNDVKVLINGHCNPFALTSLAMINDTSVLLPLETSQKLESLLKLGEEQYRSFFYDRLIYQKVSMSAPIKLNKVNLWQDDG